MRLFDTAGLRRKARITARPETLAVGDALRAIRFAEVVVMLLDAETPFEKQDLTIADLVEREGRGLVFAVNKWDLVPDPQGRLAQLKKDAEAMLPQLAGACWCRSRAFGAGARQADEGRLHRLRGVEQAHRNRRTQPLVRRRAGAASAARRSGRRIKLRYITQANARPPAFVIFSSRPEALPVSYLRYLVNDLKRTFGLGPAPVRMHIRKSKNPYTDEGGGKR